MSNNEKNIPIEKINSIEKKCTIYFLGTYQSISSQDAVHTQRRAGAARKVGGDQGLGHPWLDIAPLAALSTETCAVEGTGLDDTAQWPPGHVLRGRALLRECQQHGRQPAYIE